MIDFLYGIDKAILLFMNQTLANPVSDALWPLISDYNQHLPVQILLGGIWVGLIIWGGKSGRTVAFLLIPVLFASDKLNSEILKETINRDRPCHMIDEHRVVEGIRLLVGCGPGRSFPSSHAVNNFAVAFLFAFYLPRVRWYVFSWAALVAISRPAVGVHYPSDVLGGAAVGLLVAFLIIQLWIRIEPRALQGLSSMWQWIGGRVFRKGRPPKDGESEG